VKIIREIVRDDTVWSRTAGAGARVALTDDTIIVSSTKMDTESTLPMWLQSVLITPPVWTSQTLMVLS